MSHRFIHLRHWLVLIMLMLFMSAVQAQKITSFAVRNASIEDCLRQIKDQTGLGYLIRDNSVHSLKGISFTASNTDVQALMNKILENSGYTWEIEEGVILIFRDTRARTAEAAGPAQAAPSREITLTVKLLDHETREAAIGAVVMIRQYEAYAVADFDGIATFRNLPPGRAVVETQMLGYERSVREILLAGDMEITIRMQQTSLALEEVTVVARSSAAGSSTSSTIGRQAIDHLQATSLKDVMQLIPGQLMTGVSSMTSAERVTIRTLNQSNVNNAFGTAIVIDGVPVSDNASLDNKVGITSTGGTGVDLREIGADNIESIEIIRGIPSAEYGDLTSGAVIVNTKAGSSPLEIRSKVNPITFNTSLSKGWNLGRKYGSFHTNMDYAKASGDPRQKTTSFDRVSGGMTYTKTFKRNWYTNTKLNFSNLIDLRGTDPDVLTEGTETTQSSRSLRFSHNGRIGVNRQFMRTLSYSFGLSHSQNQSYTSTIVAAGGGLPVITSMFPGYQEVPYITSSYQASGGTEARPVSLFAKMTNGFYINYKDFRQRFNMGIEYRMDENNARGFYNEDNRLPLRPNSNGRPRPFYDIPRLNQISAFIEDNILWRLGEDRNLRLQAGVRFGMLQPGLEEQVSSVSPRFNASLKLTQWLEFRGGWGQNSKTPGLVHLYPEPRYIDRLAAQYLPTDPMQQLVIYHTHINYVERNTELENSVNTKTELGMDIKLPNDMSFSVVVYKDKMRGGFGSYSDYLIFYSNFYSVGNGIIVVPGQKPFIDMSQPERVDTVFSTRGITGNTQASLDRGIELDFFFGQIKPIRTQLYLSGAYMESQAWTTGPSYSNPVGIPASSVYGKGGSNTPPFKLEYPSGSQRTIQQRFSTVMRAVTNFPEMRMVASLSGQMIWYTYSVTTNQQQRPVGWINTDLSYNPITDEMYADPDYRIKGILLSDQIRNPKDTKAVIMPPVGLISARLSKDISQGMRLSFFANNMLYYTPYQTSNVSNTPIQRNSGTFSFGMEFFVKI